MIRLSKKEDYAILLINKLIQNYNVKLVPLSEVAKDYKISLLFLRKLARKLKEAGIIKAVEGKKGGYILEKDPKKLTVGDILLPFSNKPILDCCSFVQKPFVRCNKINFCVPGIAWRKINKEIVEKIYNVSFLEFISINKNESV